MEKGERMREILFRGKRTDTSEWVEGFYSNELYANKHYISKWYYGSYAELQRFEVIPETVGQYTGLKDTSNGKKIFEGDIILFEDESPLNYEYHDITEMRCGEIKFSDGEFYLTNRIAVEMGDLIYDEKFDGKVIGNIHDNPELLER